MRGRAWVAFDTLISLWTRDTYLFSIFLVQVLDDCCRGCKTVACTHAITLCLLFERSPGILYTLWLIGDESTAICPLLETIVLTCHCLIRRYKCWSILYGNYRCSTILILIDINQLRRMCVLLCPSILLETTLWFR